MKMFKELPIVKPNKATPCSRTVAAYDCGVSSDSAYGCAFPSQVRLGLATPVGAEACGYSFVDALSPSRSPLPVIPLSLSS
jgi:hypothetical protein